VIEIHTGTLVDALTEGRAGEANTEWELIRQVRKMAKGLGLEVHAGHGLDYASAEAIARSQMPKLNIATSDRRSRVQGLSETVKFMRAADGSWAQEVDV